MMIFLCGESLGALICNEGWQSQLFASAQEFLGFPRAATRVVCFGPFTSGINGLDLQKSIAGERPDMPIIFITGYGDVPRTVQAMKAGAVEFLTTPFSDVVLPERHPTVT